MNPIIIENAYEGNLKNISVNIPRNQLICVTGVSGSGKSTLVMDTLYQECQRQYLEATGYQGIQKPGVEAIRNLSPAIQINQHLTNKNPRSTVGTITNIYTDLRMVYENECVSITKRVFASLSGGKNSFSSLFKQLAK